LEESGQASVGNPFFLLLLIVSPRSFWVHVDASASENRSYVDASASEDHSYVDVGPWDVPVWPEVLR